MGGWCALPTFEGRRPTLELSNAQVTARHRDTVTHTSLWGPQGIISARGGEPRQPNKASGKFRTVTWSACGGCENPQYVEIHGSDASDRVGPRKRAEAKLARFMEAFYFRCDRNKETPYPKLREKRTARQRVTVEAWVKCRRCGWCLKQRRKQWAMRAMNEHSLGQRSWMCTFTLSPELHWLWSRGSTNVEEAFQLISKRVSGELTKWLKRIRFASGARLRYMIVTEKHAKKLAGLPHWHMLLTERTGSVTWEELAFRHECTCETKCEVVHNEKHRRGLQWNHGHSDFGLVKPDDNPAYATKYLTKSADAKIRASVRYGKTSSRDREPLRFT